MSGLLSRSGVPETDASSVDSDTSMDQQPPGAEADLRGASFDSSPQSGEESAAENASEADFGVPGCSEDMTRPLPEHGPSPDQPRYPPDLSRPTPNELSLIQTRPDSENAFNDAYWKTRTFTPLEDSMYQPVGDAIIHFTLTKFNGTKNHPTNLQDAKLSAPAWIGGNLWRLRVIPRGSDVLPHLKVYIENLSLGHRIRMDWPDNELFLPSFPSTKIPLSPQVAAQFSVLAYNPKDPKVFVFKNDRYQFTKDSSDRGWECFTEVASHELHIRRPYQLRPLLENDTLSFKAFIRVIKDPSRCLWPRLPGDTVVRDLVDRTGHVPLPLCGSTSAVIALLMYLEPFRRLLYRLSDLLVVRSTQDSAEKTVLCLLLQILYNMRKRIENDNDWLLATIRRKLHGLTSSNLKLAASNSADGDGIDASQTLVAFKESLMTGMLQLLQDKAIPADAQPQLIQFVNEVSQLQPIKLCPTGLSDIQELISGKVDMEQSPWKLFEIQRQVYDDVKRCWVKGCDKVGINTWLNVAGLQYRLHGIITHSGHLHSGQYMSYIRAAGVKEMWLSTTGSSASLMPLSFVANNLLGSGKHFPSATPSAWSTNGASISQRYLELPEEVFYIVCYRSADATDFPCTPNAEVWPLPDWLIKSDLVAPKKDEKHTSRSKYALRLEPDTVEDAVRKYSPIKVENEIDGDISMGDLSQQAQRHEVVISSAPAGIASNETLASSEGRVFKIEYLSQPFYEGTMQRDKYHGQGHLISMNGDDYVGNFSHGVYHGAGKLSKASGDSYAGTFSRGQYHGWGNLTLANGDIYKGEFSKGRFHGQGLYQEAETGNKYDGNWRRGEKHGRGITYWQVSDNQKRLCKLCDDAPADQLFIDCGHVVGCKSCAPRCIDCPVCREEVQGIIKVYLP